MTPPSFFSPVYPSSSSSFTWGKKTHQTPIPPLLATLFIRLLALIPVKGKFCNAWFLNLISLFLIPHSVIKLMVCVPSASLFTCAYPSFIGSSRSLNPGSNRRFFGCTAQPLSPTTVNHCKQNCLDPRVWKKKTGQNKSDDCIFLKFSNTRKRRDREKSGRGCKVQCVLL